MSRSSSCRSRDVDGVISETSSRVAVRVIHTDEELMIARSVCLALELGMTSV